jgi:hypothetical protein
MAIIEHQFSHYITTSSGSVDDNVTVSNDGSRVTISLEQPLEFSSGSISTTVEVEQASIWNTSPNISVALGNNKFYYLINSVAQPVVTVPDGLYSISTLNAELVRQITNVPNSATTVTLSGNNSTQKSILTLDITVQIDFTQPNSLREVLGFNSAIVPAAPAAFAGVTVEGDNVAAFNNTNSFTLLSDIVSNGIPLNNSGRNLIANIPITSSVGSIVNYTPFNPTLVSANELRGKSIQQFYIQIADDDGNPLPQTEPWSVLLVFKSKILISSEKMNKVDLFS